MRFAGSARAPKGSLSHLMGHLKGLLKGFLKIFPRSIKAPRGHTVPHGHTLPGTLGDTCMPFRIPGGTLNPRCPLLYLQNAWGHRRCGMVIFPAIFLALHAVDSVGATKLRKTLRFDSLPFVSGAELQYGPAAVYGTTWDRRLFRLCCPLNRHRNPARRRCGLSFGVFE